MLDEARTALIPATNAQIIEQLTPCLSQVAPSGMTEYDRGEWLIAAGMTLSETGAPFALIQFGCRAARHNSSVDHPAKIVGAVLNDMADPMRMRHDALNRARRQYEESKIVATSPIDDTPLDPSEVAATNLLMRKLRTKTRYAPDGQAFQLEPGMGDPCDDLRNAA